MDIVYIRELEIMTIIGIYDWERKLKQTVSLDLDMASDIKLAAARDDIAKALDYKQVAKRLIEFVEQSKFQLIETLAEQVAALVIKEFKVSWLRLRVGKPGAVSGAKDVGVIIERRAKAAKKTTKATGSTRLEKTKTPKKITTSKKTTTSKTTRSPKKSA